MGKFSERCSLLLSMFVLFNLISCQEDYVDYPNLSEYELPETSFTCEGKVHGGFYADIETECQMYHICSRDEKGIIRNVKFLCGNGTVFDQRYLVCQDFRKVPHCEKSPELYRKFPTYRQEIEYRRMLKMQKIAEHFQNARLN